MHEEYSDEDISYWLIIDTKKNNITYSKCIEWDINLLGNPSELNLMDIVHERGGFRGTVLQWGIPANKVIASVNLDAEYDVGEFGLGGDWWKD